MYESFFGLSGKPFTLNPDPRFFFRSSGHKRALAYMRYGLQQEQGFIVVTGDVGTGKTMLVNNLFREIEDQALVAAKIVSSNVKDVDLLRLIAAEFDMPFAGSSKASLLHDLENFFKQCRDEGKRVLLVIDEAQNLPRSALEELRMLSNFDYQGVPLVQSFLLGQREFRGIMRAPGLEQLRQRVIAAYHLKPLSHEEVKSYIEHRMRKVGWTDDPVIEEGAFERVYEATGGVPRRINTLFDRVLLNCYLDEAHAVTRGLVDVVCQEIENEQCEEGADFDEAVERPARPAAPTPVAPVAPDAMAQPAPPAASDHEVERLRRQVSEMHATIEALNARLVERGTTIAIDAAPDDGPLGPGRRRFPVWTTAFIAAVLVAIVGAGVGFFMLQG
jgi:general secretion pathway protein A